MAAIVVTVLYTNSENRISRKLAGRWLAELSYARQTELQRLRRSEDLNNSLLGMQLLKTGMSHLEFRDFHLSGVQYSANRKPHLSEAVDFSISHSGDMVVCALTRNGRIGIDTEKQRPVSIRSFSRFLSASECLASGDSSDAFLDFWTCKEAVLKGCGNRQLNQLKDITISGDAARIGTQRFYLCRLELQQGYKTCLATSTQQGHIELLPARLENGSMIISKDSPDAASC
ncbi:MAG TPA: 4'-phosphopantetheinyl transferase superfamily protein [Gammaproteobacteria bacterium]|nr:4'-phosphopantetheinyl transferase superfamily protein [Gammaproteobacteria bacterium]